MAFSEYINFTTHFSSCGHVFGYLGPSGLKERLLFWSVHPHIAVASLLRGQLPHPLVVDVGLLQELIELVVLSGLMMVVTVAWYTSPVINAGALRILFNNNKKTERIKKKIYTNKTERPFSFLGYM